MNANQMKEECAKMVDEMFERFDKADQLGPRNAMIILAEDMRKLKDA